MRTPSIAIIVDRPSGVPRPDDVVGVAPARYRQRFQSITTICDG